MGAAICRAIPRADRRSTAAPAIPRRGRGRPAAGARVLGGDLAEEEDGLRGSGLWTGD